MNSSAVFFSFPNDVGFLAPFSDFSLLKPEPLMTLLSESHVAQSEFNISEIRQ